MKTCLRCPPEQNKKSESDFYKACENICKECWSKDRKEKYKANPIPAKEAAKKWREKNPRRMHEIITLKKYGLTRDDYDAIVARQGGACAICHGPPSGLGKKRGVFHVDHDHETKKVRGLLCHHCNVMLGYARDDQKILASAISYLANDKR